MAEKLKSVKRLQIAFIAKDSVSRVGNYHRNSQTVKQKAKELDITEDTLRDIETFNKKVTIRDWRRQNSNVDQWGAIFSDDWVDEDGNIWVEKSHKTLVPSPRDSKYENREKALAWAKACLEAIESSPEGCNIEYHNGSQGCKRYIRYSHKVIDKDRTKKYKDFLEEREKLMKRAKDDRKTIKAEKRAAAEKAEREAQERLQRERDKERRREELQRKRDKREEASAARKDAVLEKLAKLLDEGATIKINDTEIDLSLKD